MKNDLKTFPVKASPQDYENWKKAFEKELREMKANHSAFLKVNLQTILKEILGE